MSAGPGERVVGQRRWCQTDMRGLGTAGRWFGWSGPLSRDRASHQHSVGRLLIVVSRVAPRAASPADRPTPIGCGWLGQSRTARDQHQPASSRATATLAITWLLAAGVEPAPAWCSRRLPASPRA